MNAKETAEASAEPGKPVGDPSTRVTKERRIALRIAAVLSGAGLIVGFVLPWLRFAEVATLSGLELLISDNVMVRNSVGVLQQRLVILVPVVGLVTLGFGIRNGPALRWVLLGGGVLLVLFGLFGLLMIFVQVTSVGLWVVAGALCVSMVAGVLVKK